MGVEKGVHDKVPVKAQMMQIVENVMKCVWFDMNVLKICFPKCTVFCSIYAHEKKKKSDNISYNALH